MTTVQKLTHTVPATDVQDNEEVVIVAEDDEVTSTENEIGNLVLDTSSEDELGNKWLQVNVQALEEEPSPLQKPANVMHIQICNQSNANFPVNSGFNVFVWYRH